MAALAVSLYMLTRRIRGKEGGSQWGGVRNHLVGRCSSQTGPQGGTPNPIWLERECHIFQEFPHPCNFHYGHQRAAGMVASRLHWSPVVLMESKSSISWMCFVIETNMYCHTGHRQDPRLPQRPKLRPPYCHYPVGTHVASSLE